VMVGAYNVGGTRLTKERGRVQAGEEIGQFGFGSTVVVLVGSQSPGFPDLPPQQRVRMGGPVATPSDGTGWLDTRPPATPLA